MIVDAGILATIASIVAAFGVAMLIFRIQRELAMSKAGERNWIAASDWLLIASTELSLLAVILPLIMSSRNSVWAKVPLIISPVSCVLLAGYIPGILAHYRLIWSAGRIGPRQNPEPAESAVIVITVIVAIAAGLSVLRSVIRNV